MAGLGAVAIVGAGMAGLACARKLADAGIAVTVVDKGRGLGGRIASRRSAAGPVDHGAVALRPGDAGPSGHGAAYAAMVQEAAQQGLAAAWPAAAGWVGLPGMSAIVQPLARGLSVQQGAEVTGLERVGLERAGFERVGQGWRLQGAGVPGAVFDQVILALPQPQAQALLAPVSDLPRQITAVRMRPVWTAMACFDRGLALSGDVIAPAQGPVAMALRNSAKPGRARPGPQAAGDVWVLHADAAWTAAHLEMDKPEAAERLLAAFLAGQGLAAAAPDWLEGHRWRYGLTVTPLGQPFARDPVAGLAVCGDWCLGDTAGHAFASGSALADALLRDR